MRSRLNATIIAARLYFFLIILFISTNKSLGFLTGLAVVENCIGSGRLHGNYTSDRVKFGRDTSLDILHFPCHYLYQMLGNVIHSVPIGFFIFRG